MEYFEHNDRALAEGENKGLIKILMNKRGRVIGVQMVSYHAGDLIGEWIPVLNGKAKFIGKDEQLKSQVSISSVSTI